ncbi:MAG: DUF4956 domain-containing protein [Oscillospiraceae bacterium]|nr:DUF4956 domain-containing protein [Oscillospiraceae bacterium]
MLDLFTSISADGATTATFLISLIVALICGGLTAAASAYRSRVSAGFVAALILLPAVVMTVIALVNGNVGTGVAVMGAFSLIRFRSVPGKARDIVAIFLVMTAGLACAGGYVAIALAVTVIACLGMALCTRLPVRGARMQELRITVPESLHFQGAFDEVFDEYASHRELRSVKTSNMGSLYKLTYEVELKDEKQMQAFIDALRCRNGNLEIAINRAEERSEAL